MFGRQLKDFATTMRLVIIDDAPQKPQALLDYEKEIALPSTTAASSSSASHAPMAGGTCPNVAPPEAAPAQASSALASFGSQVL